MKKIIILKRETPLSLYVSPEKVEWFIKALRLDFQNATKKYEEMERPKYTINLTENFFNQYNELKEKIEKKAETLYKRKSFQDKYIKDELYNKIMKFATEVKDNWKNKELTYFDFNCFPFRQGIDEYCIIRKGRLDDESLMKCWEIVVKSKYFQKANGWQFVYYDSRPQIELILPKELQKEYDNDKRILSDAINNFYKNTNYWGD